MSERTFLFLQYLQNNSIINSKISMLQYLCEIWNPTHISKLQKCMYFMYHKCKCTYLFCLNTTYSIRAKYMQESNANCVCSTRYKCLYGVLPNQQIHVMRDWASCQLLPSMHPGCHQIQSPHWWCLNKSATSVISNESVSSESIPSLAVRTHAHVDKKQSGSDRPDFFQMLNCLS